MKRAILLCVLTEMTFAGITAAPVDRNAALISAEKFLVGRGIERKLIPLAPDRESRATTTGSEAYHIFNSADGNGYVIIAGDDRAQTVLAYSTTGSLDYNDMPEACREWLSQYAGQIAALPADDSPTSSLSRTIDYPATVVTPLLKSKWDQGSPYNLDCPVDKNTGRQSLTGCVATATAQVMYYYRHPQQPTGSITYDDSSQGVSRTLDFAALPPFDWANMTDTYGSSSSDESKKAVAALMNAVGHGVKMNYSSNTSIAYNRNAADALHNYFGYSENIHFYERRFMTDSEWTDIVTAELIAGRPIIYDGRNASMGHTFVCDGYDGNGYYHFNWGWSGMSDGYFTLSALNPDQQAAGGSDNGYTHSQSIICNIAPAGLSETAPQSDFLLSMQILYFMDAKGYYEAATNPAVTSALSDAQLFFYADNIGYEKFNGEVWAATTDNGVVTPIVKAVPVQGTYTTGYIFPLSDAGLTDGTYTIGFYYTQKGSDRLHRVAISGAQPSTCRVNIDGENVTMYPVTPYSEITLASDFISGTLYAGKPATWTFDIQNSGTFRMEGYAGVALIGTDGSEPVYFTTQILAAAGESMTVTVNGNLSGVTAGEYRIMPFITTVLSPSAADITALSRPMEVTVNQAPSLLFMPENYMSYFMMDKSDESVNALVTNLLPSAWSGLITATVSKTDGTVFPGTLSALINIDGGAASTVGLKANDIALEAGTHYINFYFGDDAEHHLTSSVIMVTDNHSALESVGVDLLEIQTAPGQITITSSGSLISNVRISDLSGRCLLNRTVNSHRTEIATTDIADGIHIITVTCQDSAPVTKKIIIRNH